MQPLNKQVYPNQLIPLIAMGILTVAWSPTELSISLQSLSSAKLLLQSPATLTDFQEAILTELLTCSLLIIYLEARV